MAWRETKPSSGIERDRDKRVPVGMKALVALAVLVLPTSVQAQPGPTIEHQRMMELLARIHRAQEVTDLRIAPERPTERDTLTVSFRALVPSACGYVHEVQAIGPSDPPPDERREASAVVLNVRFALPANAECTADLAAERLLTVRIPPKPAGTYALRMKGYGSPDRTDFIHDGPDILFTVTKNTTPARK